MKLIVGTLSTFAVVSFLSAASAQTMERKTLALDGAKNAINWDPEKKVIMRYEVAADATLSNGKVFFDMTTAPGEDALDGMKVGRQGNLTSRVLAAYGSFRPPENIWERLSRPSIHTISPGAEMTVRRSI